MLTREQINNAEQFHTRAYELANRWLKINGLVGYYCYDLCFNFQSRTVFFGYKHSNGVVFPKQTWSFSFTYLIDDSDFDKDQTELYQIEEQKRIDRLNKERELENDPKVREYLDFKGRQAIYL